MLQEREGREVEHEHFSGLLGHALERWSHAKRDGYFATGNGHLAMSRAHNHHQGTREDARAVVARSSTIADTVITRSSFSRGEAHYRCDHSTPLTSDWHAADTGLTRY